LDAEAIKYVASETGSIITVEEHSLFGGLGSAVAEIVVQYQPVPMKIIAIPDENAINGTSGEIFNHYGLTKENIVNEALKLIKANKK
jgi:transketolase